MIRLKNFREFLNEEDGMGTVEVILIIVVLVGLVSLQGLALSGCGRETIVVESAAAQTLQTETEAQAADTYINLATRPAGLTVYVCGAVEAPGVYHLPEGARVYEAIALAGGLRENADPEAQNQAEILTDGQMLKIWTKQEVRQALENAGQNQATGASGLININTASKDALMTLPGIGEAKADAIVAWRQEHGAFSEKEEIMQISGIKESVFQKIGDKICV